MIVTGSAQLRDEARIYRDQGKGAFTTNHHVRHGASWRMSQLNAAVGEVHLRRLKEFVDTRRRVAATYTAALAGVPGLRPAGRTGRVPQQLLQVHRAAARRRRPVPVQGRGRRARRPASGEVYDLPLHRQPVFEKYADGPLPVAEDVCARHVCLPVHSDMRDDEVDHVLTAVTAVYSAMAR